MANSIRRFLGSSDHHRLQGDVGQVCSFLYHCCNNTHLIMINQTQLNRKKLNEVFIFLRWESNHTFGFVTGHNTNLPDPSFCCLNSLRWFADAISYLLAGLDSKLEEINIEIKIKVLHWYSIYLKSWNRDWSKCPKFLHFSHYYICYAWIITILHVQIATVKATCYLLLSRLLISVDTNMNPMRFWDIQYRV